jgi:flagellar protein FlaF
VQSLAKQTYPQATTMTAGYAQNQKIVDLNRESSPAEIDAMVLQEAASRLQKAQENPSSDFFEQSLRYNQLIWTVIQSEMTAENPLSGLIKANLISLSIFVDKQTPKAIGRRDPDLLDALIDINRNISLGLARKATK